MRSDMSKVVVERPRSGHQARYPRKKVENRYDCAFEDYPTRQPVGRRRYGEKHFSDHLSPLFRFLRKNVGRPWNNVWSELCEHVSFDNVVQKHILSHVDGFVALHVVLIDGEVYYYSSHSGLRALVGSRWLELYVCPRTGLLKQAKHGPRKKRKKEVDPNVIAVTRDERLRRVEGIWYREWLGHTPDSECVVLRRRQLGSRELRQRGL